MIVDRTGGAAGYGSNGGARSSARNRTDGSATGRSDRNPSHRPADVMVASVNRVMIPVVHYR
jgi:hypothetical protein